MTNFRKIIRIGTRKRVGNVFCTIEYVNGKLSISGVEGPLASGNCRGSCGQIDLSGDDWTDFAAGWTQEMVDRLISVWAEYHLNEMKAGSPAQTAFLKANPIADRLNYYTAACAALESAGLNPDPNYLHNGQPYRYGSAWLKIDVPSDAVEFLASLPDADMGMPYAWSHA